MTEAVKILRSGKRYRGFLGQDSSFVPVTLTAYPIDARNVRIRYIFPISLGDRVRKGSTLYLLVEDRGNRIAELRVIKKEGRDFIAVLDFVTEDRRRIPRVKVEDLLDIEAQVDCGGRILRGKVVDISLISIGIRLVEKPQGGACRITVIYEGLKTSFTASLKRFADSVAVFEIKDGNGDMVGFLRKVYSGIFLKVQRSFQS